MTTSEAQERVISHLVSHIGVVRAEVRAMADHSREVWCYDANNVLLFICTVFRDGLTATRPGIRHTTNRRVGHLDRD